MANPKYEISNNDTTIDASVATVDMKLEAIVIPVSDVERAQEFYRKLGWRQDVTPPGSGVFQFTPHGSACSVQFGKNLTSAAPGSAQRTYLIVSDIEAARDKLVAAGIEVSEFFHLGPERAASAVWIPSVAATSRSHRSAIPTAIAGCCRRSRLGFRGRVDPGAISFGSASDLASAFRRAEAAHGEHEKRTGAARCELA